MQNMKVLVVDDDQDQLIVRCMLVSHHGFETVRAGDADSALRLALSKHVDAAVVDLHLPLIEAGLKLLGDLKTASPRIHLIVITGTDPARLKHFPELRFADEVLLKGSSAKALVASLNRLSRQRVA